MMNDVVLLLLLLLLTPLVSSTAGESRMEHSPERHVIEESPITDSHVDGDQRPPAGDLITNIFGLANKKRPVSNSRADMGRLLPIGHLTTHMLPRLAGSREQGLDRLAGGREQGMDRLAGSREQGLDRLEGSREQGLDRLAGSREQGLDRASSVFTYVFDKGNEVFVNLVNTLSDIYYAPVKVTSELGKDTNEMEKVYNGVIKRFKKSKNFFLGIVKIIKKILKKRKPNDVLNSKEICRNSEASKDENSKEILYGGFLKDRSYPFNKALIGMVPGMAQTVLMRPCPSRYADSSDDE